MRRWVLLLCAAAWAGAQAAPAATGRWQGQAQIPGAALPMVVDLQERAGSGWVGSVMLPGRGVAAAPLSDIRVSEQGVQFSLAAAFGGDGDGSGGQQPTQARLRWLSDGRLAGEFHQAGHSAALVLTRSGAPQLDPPRRPGAVADDLAGVWHGRYVLHNQQGFQGSPAIANGRVFIGGRDAHVYALELNTGREQWRFSTGNSWVISSPAVHAGRVYFATSDSSLVHAVDAASGQPLWQQQGQAFVFSSPTIAGNSLVLGVLNGSVEARSTDTGERRWSWHTEAATANLGWPLTADGRINGALLFNHGWHDSMAQGAARQFSIGAVFATPLVVNRVVYIGCAGGRLVALE